MKKLLTIADTAMDDRKRLSMLDLLKWRDALGDTAYELEPEYIFLAKDNKNEKV